MKPEPPVSSTFMGPEDTPHRAAGPPSGGLLRVILAVVAEDLALPVDDGDEVDGAAPDALQGGQRRLGVLLVQVGALVAVPQQQLGAVVVVGVLHEDERLAEVGELEEDLLLHLLELARVDLVVAAALVEPEGEELVL